MILENESILSFFISTKQFFFFLVDLFNKNKYLISKEIENNLQLLGRVACIQFDNILDALVIYSGDLKIKLPLINGTVDEPQIFPSTYLTNYIESFSAEKT